MDALVADTETLHAYAIIDAAKIAQTSTQLLIYAPEHRNLFEASEAEQYAEVAPYLVKLAKECAFGQWVWQEVYGQNASVFLYSTQEIDALALHLREHINTRVEMHNQDKEPIDAKVYMRFYDPRVLPNYLAYSQELETFFEGIDALLCEVPGQEGDYYHFSHNKEGLIKETKGLKTKELADA